MSIYHNNLYKIERGGISTAKNPAWIGQPRSARIRVIVTNARPGARVLPGAVEVNGFKGLTDFMNRHIALSGRYPECQLKHIDTYQADELIDDRSLINAIDARVLNAKKRAMSR